MPRQRVTDVIFGCDDCRDDEGYPVPEVTYRPSAKGARAAQNRANHHAKATGHRPTVSVTRLGTYGA